MAATVYFTSSSFAKGLPPINYLYEYTQTSEDCQANPSCMEAITSLITDKETGKTVKEGEEVIVYRGQKESQVIDPNRHPWFSTSTNLEATNTFRSDSCCVFTIHLMPGTKYIDVNKLLAGSAKARGSVSAGRLAKNASVTHGLYDEREIIVLGGGMFYSSLDGTPGFKALEAGNFETWYSPIPLRPTPTRVGGAGTVAVASPTPSKKKVTLEELITRAKEELGEEDYETFYGDASNRNSLIRNYLNKYTETLNTTVGGAHRKTRKQRRYRRKSRYARRHTKK